VAVALIATVAALHLLLRPHDLSDEPAADDQLSAGRVELSFEAFDDTEELAPEVIVITVTLDRNTYLADQLQNAGLSAADARKWTRAFLRTAKTHKLWRGRAFSMFRDPETGELRGIRYDLDQRSAVVEEHLGHGIVQARVRPIEYYSEPVIAAFPVEGDFRRVARRNGLPSAIVEALEDAFADKHKLGRFRTSAMVKVIYEQKVSADGRYTQVGDVEAAEIRIGGQTLKAFAFRDEHGRAHLYDEDGRPLGPQFLRFPLKYSYISSGFLAHRFHPILRRYRPHVGIDLAARHGTPVKAVADGRVRMAGWGGELGHAVKIEHDGGFVSTYGHLSRIAPNVYPNNYVRIGQVIGYVGSSGLATGPHLHYALEKRGKYVNPLTQKLGANREVSPRMRALFHSVKRQYEQVLANLPDFTATETAAEAGTPGVVPAAYQADQPANPKPRAGRRSSSRRTSAATESMAGASSQPSPPASGAL
jgi:murein DD-endopeptidase MepM/ murein hydrolase activator NlpD